jgi:hypothetical protein
VGLLFFEFEVLRKPTIRPMEVVQFALRGGIGDEILRQ